MTCFAKGQILVIPWAQPERGLFPPQTPNYVGLFQLARERDSVSGNAFRNGLEPLPQFLQLLSCHHSRPKAGPQLGYPSCYPEIEMKKKVIPNMLFPVTGHKPQHLSPLNAPSQKDPGMKSRKLYFHVDSNGRTQSH